MKPYFDDGQIVLYHGDNRDVTEWLTADVLVTDPPYGMAFRSGKGGAFGRSEIAGDDDLSARDAVMAAWGGRPALVFGRWSIAKPEGTRMCLTWEKGNHVGMGDLALPWKPNTEEVYVLGNGFVGHRGTSVLRHLAIAGTVGRADTGTRRHPTEKPVGLMEELIAKCPPGVIADPFAGSGTTLVAAQRLGRRAIGVELDERYCEAAAKRLSEPPLFALGEAS